MTPPAAAGTALPFWHDMERAFRLLAVAAGLLFAAGYTLPAPSPSCYAPRGYAARCDAPMRK